MKKIYRHQAVYAFVGFLALAAALTVPVPADAASAVNVDRNGVAIKGYDPVAYFTVSEPVKGKKDHEVTWMGATWRFASSRNSEMFQKAPAKYAPRYGGYCAYGVAENALFDIDPRAWTVHEGRLYLNKSLGVRDLWKKDIPGHIERADASWPGLSGMGEMMDEEGMMKDAGGKMMDDDGKMMDDQGKMMDDQGKMMDEPGTMEKDSGSMMK